MKKLIYIFATLFVALGVVATVSDNAYAHAALNAFNFLDTMPSDHTGLGVIVANSGLAVFSADEIERKAQQLSNYAGGKLSYYTGTDDDLVSFEGDIRSFAQELDKNLEKQFSIIVANGNAATRSAAIQSGYFLGNAVLQPGQLVEGAFNDTTGAAGLSGSTPEQKSIQELFLFLNNCPTRLLAMKIESTVQGQINQNLTYQRLNPFKTEENKIIRPKNYINQDTFQNNQVTFPVDVQLDALSRLLLSFVGTSTTTFTMFFGASINLQYALEKKFERAKNTIAAVRGR